MKITPELVRASLDYNPVTGVFTWKLRDESMFRTKWAATMWNRKHPGNRAGKVSDIKRLGYKCRRISLFGKYYLEHRLAWMFMTGEAPPRSIDHVNGDGMDNRWSNLRDGTSANRKNIGMFRNNTSGACGVSRDSSGLKWRGRVYLNGDSYSLGTFDNLEDAQLAVEKKRHELGFSDRHGKPQP